MATFRTTDHEEIRSWIAQHGGVPAVVRQTTRGDATGVLTLVFGEPEGGADENVERITWREFFDLFEDGRYRLRYEAPVTHAKAARVYSFEGRDSPVDSSEESETVELPEDVDRADENLFPSAPDAGQAMSPETEVLES